MAVVINKSDTFEEWRVKCNEIAADSYTAVQIGDMVTGANTENGISVSFDTTTNTLNFDVDDFALSLDGDLSGSATVNDLSNTTLTASINTNYVASGSTSGNGLSGSISSIGGAFTVTSNATSSNSGGTIVYRDASGDFSAGDLTVTGIISSGNISGSAGAFSGALSSSSLTTTSTIVAGGSVTVNADDGSSNIYMGDTDEGNRTIHCNSNLIGFLKQDNNWGAYCDDNGNWTAAGDITASGGDMYATNFHGKATTATYADLAENYIGDAQYEVGTVISLGGDWEVTQSTVDMDRRIIGVVSTAPAYLMNSEQQGEFVIPVALTGRVPCKVTGSIKAGDMLVSNGDGSARAEEAPRMGSVIGKALSDSDGTNIIEVVVGKL